MKLQIACVLTVLALAPQNHRTFTGTITDAMCDRANHAAMRMGPTDAECATACAEEHDAAYVLFDGKQVYQLSDQKTAARFAAQHVSVVGALNTKTKMIQIDSITAAP
jgi:hypothetical protein